MNLQFIDAHLRCPRCNKAWVTETVMDGKVLSFACMNPDKGECGYLFLAEHREPGASTLDGHWASAVVDKGPERGLKRYFFRNL